jgi:hypothetical protein
VSNVHTLVVMSPCVVVVVPARMRNFRISSRAHVLERALNFPVFPYTWSGRVLRGLTKVSSWDMNVGDTDSGQFRETQSVSRVQGLSVCLSHTQANAYSISEAMSSSCTLLATSRHLPGLGT